MKTLFGKPKIQYSESVNGASIGEWKELDMPNESTATLETKDGETTSLKDEAGKTVDSYTAPGDSTLVFELFKKKGVPLPFKGENGVIPGEFAFRVSNANDENAPAFQIDRSTVVGKKLWTKKDALRIAYTVTALEPREGDMVKLLGVDVDKTELSFSSAADSTGKTVNVEASNGVVTAEADDEFVTVTVSENIVTVKVSANTEDEARTAVVTITDATGFSTQVAVTQAAAA